MRKVILGVAVSLDGFIEGPDGEYDWCFTDQDYGMTAFLKNVDAIFFGRKSYEVMMRAGSPPGGNLWDGMKNYVFSNTLKTPLKDARIVNGDVKAEVIRIKSQAGKDIWLFGGASLAGSLLNEGLIDELWLAVHPILLGKGKPLFTDLNGRIKTELVSSRAYKTGLVSLIYRVAHPE